MKTLVGMLVLMCFAGINTEYAHGFDHGTLYEMFAEADALDGTVDGYAKSLTSQVCARCHDAKIDEIMQTVHYTFESENTSIHHPGGGKHGHYDRSSGFTGGSTLANYVFDDHERGCGKCHVGKYLPGTMNERDLLTGAPTANMAKVRDGIDCLICHAARYVGRDNVVQETMPDGGTEAYWHQDRTWEAVKTIRRPTTDHCLRCHRETAVERGTPFEPWSDVHLASKHFRGNACTKCHTVSHHKMVRGNYISELFSSDYEVGSPENELQCQKCHGNAPHEHKAILNEHVEKIACQTCHIPWTSGVTYATWQDEGQVQYARTNMYSAADTRPYVTEGKTERELWREYKIRPRYLWFNGQSSFIAQPYGTKGDASSKIWPFKPFISGIPMDRTGLRMVDMYDDATIQRAMVALGVMNPGSDPRATAAAGAGTLGNRTTDSSLSIESQDEMYSTALFLNMDLTVLRDTTNLDVAVNSAMAKSVGGLNFLGKMLGAEADSPLLAIFNGQYPGESYRVSLFPTGENMQKKFGPNYPAGSFFTLTHGVKKAREALRCNDCHSSNSIFKNNKLLSVDGYDANGDPQFREITNCEVLGLGCGEKKGKKH